MRVPAEIFKAYDIRGLYGEQIDGDDRLPDRPRLRPGARPTCAASRPRELRIGLGRDMRLQAPEMAAALARRAGRRGRARARRRHGRHRDALLPGRLARARRRRDGAPPRTTRRPTPASSSSREGALALSGDAGIGDVRDQIEAGLGDAPGGGARRGGRHLRRRSSAHALSFIDPDAIRPLKVVVDGGNGMAGPMVGPLLERARARPRRDLLGARRRVPRPRAEPAAAREPRVHHRPGARARAPTSASPGTATPTAASSSTTPASSSTATSSPRCSPSACSRKQPGRDDPLRRPRQPRGARHGRAPPAARALINRVGHAFFKTRMRERGRGLRRRGLGPLLLPRLLLRRLGHDPGAADARAALGRAASALGELIGALPLDATSSPARSTPRSPTRRRRWRRSQRALRRRRDQPSSTASRSTTRTGTSTCALEHRAAAAPQPRVARLARGHGAPSATRSSG